MSSLEQQVIQFNNTYGKEMSDKPRLPTAAEALLMHTLIMEEVAELNEAIENDDLIELADAVGDILYITAQQASMLGLPIDALLREIQRSNLSKLGSDGKPIYRADGKVLKGENFSEPEIARVLNDNYFGEV